MPTLAIIVGDGAYGMSGEVSAVFWMIVGPWLLATIVLLFKRYVWMFILKGDRIESRFGIISRSIRALRYQDIRNINMSQSIIGRLLDYGDVEFSSAGGAGIEVAFRGVVSPMALQEAVRRRLDRTD